MILRAAPACLALLFNVAAEAADPPRRGGGPFRDCETCPEMIVLPSGTFTLGTPAAAGAEGDAVPVRIPRAFAIARHEVTRLQYARFVADSGHEGSLGCRNWDPALARFADDARRSWRDPATPVQPLDAHPVTCVSQADAQAYARWLARETGEAYRLPSEAEWEYAARAGSTGLRPWGEDPQDGCEHANVYDLSGDAAYRLGWTPAGCRDGTADLAPVGSYGASAFGLHDMIGNVAEWVEDCATDSYVGRPQDGRAWTWIGGCDERVLRGGSWLSPPDQARSAIRQLAPGGLRADHVGFRVARDLDEREARREER